MHDFITRLEKLDATPSALLNDTATQSFGYIGFSTEEQGDLMRGKLRDLAAKNIVDWKETDGLSYLRLKQLQLYRLSEDDVSYHAPDNSLPRQTSPKLTLDMLLYAQKSIHAVRNHDRNTRAADELLKM